MKKNPKEVVENLKAQIKCVQSDMFTALKRYINVLSLDAILKEIIKQPYYTVNKTKYIQGLEGERNYGVIENYDADKRDLIVEEAKARLSENPVDNKEKVLEMELIVLNYQQAGSFINNVTLVSALKSHLINLRTVYVYMLEREAAVAPKCLN